MPTLSGRLNDVDKATGSTFKKLLARLAEKYPRYMPSTWGTDERFSIAKSAKTHSEMSQTLLHAIGYGPLLEKDISKLSVKEIEHIRCALAIHLTRVHAFFNQQMALILATIPQAAEVAENTKRTILRGALISGIIEMSNKEVEALNNLLLALNSELITKKSKPTSSGSPLLPVHRTGPSDYPMNSSFDDLMQLLFGGPNSNTDFFGWYQYNQGFQAGMVGANPPWYDFLSSDYSQGYQQGQLDQVIGQALNYMDQEIANAFRATGHLAQHAVDAAHNAAPGLSHDVASIVQESVKGLDHLAGTLRADCCDLSHALGNCCSGVDHDITRGAADVVHGCSQSFSSIGQGACDILTSVLKLFGECCRGLGRIDGDCLQGLGGVGGGATMLGGAAAGGGKSDQTQHKEGSDTSAANDTQPQHFLGPRGNEIWWGVMALLAVVMVRNTLYTAQNIRKDGFKADKILLGLTWITAIAAGITGFMLHVSEDNKEIGGPKTGLGAGLLVGFGVYHLLLMINKGHDKRVYQSKDAKRDLMSSTTLMALRPPKKSALVSEAMHALQRALKLVEKEDMAGCSRVWFMSKLLAYHTPAHDALFEAQHLMRNSDFVAAKDCINNLTISPLMTRYEQNCTDAVNEVKALLDKLAGLNSDTDDVLRTSYGTSSLDF